MKKTLATLAALGLAASASAQSTSVNIKYRDLNLATPEGQAALDFRVDKAARTICGLDTKTVGSRIRDRDAAKCYKTAKTKARNQVSALIEQSAKGG